MSQIVVCDLLAEMRLPGRAWLEFEVQPTTTGSQIRQTAMFDPVGLAGLAYWYLVYPLHEIVFAGMLRGIVRAARSQTPTLSPGNLRERQAAWLLGLVAICFAAAGLGGAVTSVSVGDWYQTLAKPSWTPPDWLFGPVWTTLYFPDGSRGMARVASRAVGVPRKHPRHSSALQLAMLNVAWSAIFFGMRSPGIGIWRNCDPCGWRLSRRAISFWSRSTTAAPIVHALSRLDDFRCFVEFRHMKV